MHHSHLCLLLGAALASATLLAPPSVCSAQTTTVVARTGDPAPDGNGELVDFIDDPSDELPKGFPAGLGAYLNDAGQVVFTAWLENTSKGTANNSASFRVDNCSQLVELAREGDVPPDGDGIFNLFNTLSLPALNDSGLAAFDSFLRESDSGRFFETAIFSIDDQPGAVLHQLIRTGDTAPGSERIIQDVFDPSINNSGQIGFTGVLEAFDPLGERAIFKADLETGVVTLLACEDDSPPDGRGTFDLLAGGAINEAGQVVFSSNIDSTIFDDRGIFRVEPDETFTRIVRRNDPSPDSGETFSQFSSVGNAINSAGEVVFASIMSDSGGTEPPSSAGIFLGDGERIVPLARSGQSAPGGGVFIGFGTPGSFGTVIHPLNDAGQVSFFAFTSVTRGIFRAEESGDVVAVALAGQPAPGGGVFQMDSSPMGFDSNDRPVMNEAGQVAFFTNVDIGPILDEAIFLYDDELGLMEVVREGEPFFGSTITEVRFRSGNTADNARSGLNNHGHVTFVFELADDRSGVAIWSPSGSPCDPVLVGDLDGDGLVGFNDLLILLAAWGDCPGCPEDIDGDGVVGFADLLIVLTNWT